MAGAMSAKTIGVKTKKEKYLLIQGVHPSVKVKFQDFSRTFKAIFQ
jgi:hypothetical protein